MKQNFPLKSCIVFLLIPSLIAACTRSRSSHDKPPLTQPSPYPPDVKQYFVHGDPLKIIQGSTNSPSTPFNENDRILPPLNEVYSLVGVTVFLEKQKDHPESRNINKTNRLQNLESTPALNESFIRQQSKLLEGSRVFRWNPPQRDADHWSFSSTEQKFLLNPDSNGNLQIKEWVLGTNSIPINPIHFSSTHNFEVMSLLVWIDSAEYGRQLIAFYWQKNGPWAARPYPEDRNQNSYNYFFGRNQFIGWDQTKNVTLSLCGSPSQFDYLTQNIIIRSFLNWKIPLNNRLSLNLNRPTQWPAFSDLNVHCLQFINDYNINSDQSLSEPAVTMAHFDGLKYHIIDADVFIFTRELEKIGLTRYGNYYDGNFNLLLSKILAHEFGHFLGLGHEDRKNEQNEYLFSSVMNYNRSVFRPTAFDIQAIYKLYPTLKPNSQ